MTLLMMNPVNIDSSVKEEDFFGVTSLRNKRESQAGKR